MKNINWGIIGLGNIASIVAESFKSINNCKLKGISSKNINRLNYFKKKFNIEESFCFNNYSDLINCSDIDIVYIALPNNLHYQWIIECIKANKNILVEKPALLNSNQVLDIKKRLNENNIYFTEAFMYKFGPHIKVVSDEIFKGSIGEIKNMSSDFSIKTYKTSKIFGFTFKKPNLLNRKYNKDLGGGSIYDLGCYPLSLSTQIASLKKPISLNKTKIENIEKNMCESGVEISASCTLKFENDFYSDISCSFEKNSNQQTVITGTLGTINFENTWKPNKKFKINLNTIDKNKTIEIDINENIYSYQISEISNQLLKSQTKPDNPAISIDEILLNTSIMNNWIDYKV